ncbi:hypothetical protein CHARACLAT_013802 [Characodon lateralis]|uniref:Uncharacterized protein n=1 Tax=Characodon lateralis TaxID=208331 RepID=A0ABU7F3V3_9TELE|nr:hypothetical protein [Characodon lateralis]
MASAKERIKQENIFKAHISSTTTNLAIWTLQGSTKDGYTERWKNFYSLTRVDLIWMVLMDSNITGMTRGQLGHVGSWIAAEDAAGIFINVPCLWGDDWDFKHGSAAVHKI